MRHDLEKQIDTDFAREQSKLAKAEREIFDELSKKCRKRVQLMRAIMGAQVIVYSFLVYSYSADIPLHNNRKKRDAAKKNVANEIHNLDKIFIDLYGETLKQAGWNMKVNEKKTLGYRG
jgi:hypothetical protein